MAWVNPTGFSDPSGLWEQETDAYDDSTSTCAYQPYVPAETWGEIIEFSRPAIPCDKIRVYPNAYYGNGQIDIDLYYDGDWHDLYQGDFIHNDWNEYEFSQQIVSAVRFRIYNGNTAARHVYIYEVDFWEIPTVPPTVQTDDATSIDREQATLNGQITDTGGEDADERGFDWGEEPGVYTEQWTEQGTYGTGAFNHQITGLDPNKTYYFRAKAHNSAGWAYGSELSFTTDPMAAPTVQTDPATVVSDDGAVLNGDITDTGGEDADERGFDWGEEPDVYTEQWTEQGTYGTGAFNHQISGLDPNTQYYFRAKAHNDQGSSYGEERLFTTNPSTPACSTSEASQLFDDRATLNGNVTDDGGETCQVCFQWGETIAYGQQTDWQDGFTASDPFSQLISDLDQQTLYHFRAHVKNSVGTASGEDRTFTTPKKVYHPILDGQYTEETPGINRVYVIGRDEEGNPVYGSSLNQAEIDKVGERLDFTLETSIPTAEDAAAAAQAMLDKRRLTGSRGFILIPPNCGQELWDVIQITDKLCAQDEANYRVIGIRFDYEPRKSRYVHRLILGAP